MVILDRDGTIVVDRGYLSDPAGLEFLPGAAEGLRWLHERGYRLVVITNQSGVGRGRFTYERVLEMNARLEDMVKAAGARLEAIYVCPHAPDAGCDCRKPALGLLMRAAAELHFDPARAIVIGDKESDIEFGQSVGATTVLIAGRPTRMFGAQFTPDLVATDLLAAAKALADLDASAAAPAI